MKLWPALTPAEAWGMPWDVVAEMLDATREADDEDEDESNEPPGIAKLRRMIGQLPSARR